MCPAISASHYKSLMDEWKIKWEYKSDFNNEISDTWLFQNNNLTSVINHIDLILQKKQHFTATENEIRKYVKHLFFSYHIRPIRIKILIFLLEDFTFNETYSKILKTLQKCKEDKKPIDTSTIVHEFNHNILT